MFIEVSMVHHSHFVIFIFLQGKLCFSMCYQVTCLEHVSFCRKNAIFQLCLLHEDGIVEACIPVSI